jgi:arsenate reductase-like glutaredoxin family protein
VPPSREFLEQHVGERDFLDFVSRRSPVFKQRPLPKTRREAIDLMMEHPNMIKRPILVKGREAVFGFDKDAFAKLTGRGPRRGSRAGTAR